MKDIETVHKDTIDMKKLRQERRIERAKQMVVPDASTADFERQLKKLATRGGTFAIPLSPHTNDVCTNHIPLESHNADCCVPLWDVFAVVALFNAIAKAKRDTVATEEAATKKEPVKDDTENTSVLSREKGHQASKQKAAKQSADAQEGAAAGGEKGAKWAALRDDYMIGSNLTVKVCVPLLAHCFSAFLCRHIVISPIFMKLYYA